MRVSIRTDLEPTTGQRAAIHTTQSADMLKVSTVLTHRLRNAEPSATIQKYPRADLLVMMICW